MAAFGVGDDHALYLHARQGAPKGKIVRLPLSNPDLAKAEVVVPEGPVAIAGDRPFRCLADLLSCRLAVLPTCCLADLLSSDLLSCRLSGLPTVTANR